MYSERFAYAAEVSHFSKGAYCDHSTCYYNGRECASARWRIANFVPSQWFIILGVVQVRTSFKSLLVAVMLVLSPAAAFADFYTQLNGAGQTFTYSGSTSALSVYDTNPVTAPDLPLLAAAFDNFTLGTTSSLTNLQWTGTYEDASAGLAHKSPSSWRRSRA
jgi:hypothetical protein